MDINIHRQFTYEHHCINLLHQTKSLPFHWDKVLWVLKEWSQSRPWESIVAWWGGNRQEPICARHIQNISLGKSVIIFTDSAQGVFLVKMKNVFAPIKRVFRLNTYSRFLTVPWGSEQSEWASPWMERSSKASVAKQSAAKPVSGVSGVSGASERT